MACPESRTVVDDVQIPTDARRAGVAYAQAGAGERKCVFQGLRHRDGNRLQVRRSGIGLRLHDQRERH